MFKLPRFLLVAALVLALFPLPVAAIHPDNIFSRSAILMDADTGQVLFDKNMNQTAYPASTTKILTALLAAEHGGLDETVSVSRSAVDIPEWNSANMSLIAGEQLSVESLLYGLMLQSANDAANTLAEYVAGSQERFAEMMNQRAWDVGARNTRFVNAHGLHDDGHYTTAYDLALITREAARNDTFMQFFGGDTYTVPPTNLQPIERDFFNFQSMLVQDTGYYDSSVTGGKVGYTTEAQHTMSTVATRDGRTLIAVVMYSTERTEKFYDTKRLLDYGFSQFSPVSLPASAFETGSIPMGDGEARFYTEDSFIALLHNDVDPAQVRIEFGLPEAFASDDLLPTYFPVVIDDGQASGLPSVLGFQPVISELTVDGVIVPQAAEQEAEPTFFHLIPGIAEAFRLPPLTLAAMLLTGILLALIGVVLARCRTLRRRRQRRVASLTRPSPDQSYGRSA